MEIRNYLRVIWGHIWWLLVPVVAIVAITLVFTLIFQESHYVPLSFSVNRIAEEDAKGQYQYDGYYALEANRLLGAQFAAWLRNGSLLVDIYDRAGLEEKSSFLSSEHRIIQRSSASVEFRFQGRDKERLSKLAQASISVVEDNKENFEGTGEDKIATVKSPTKFTIGTKKASIPKNLLSALGIGIIIGLIFVYLKEVFAKKSE